VSQYEGLKLGIAKKELLSSFERIPASGKQVNDLVSKSFGDGAVIAMAIMPVSGIDGWPRIKRNNSGLCGLSLGNGTLTCRNRGSG